MELFVSTEALIALERGLPSSQGETRINTLVQLAWHLRERDSRRAETLVTEAQQALNQHPLDDNRQVQLTARLQLCKAMLSILFGRHDKARAQLQSALQLFQAIQHRLGEGDVHWVDGFLAMDAGNPAVADACIARASQAYEQSGDRLRIDIAGARRLFYLGMRRPAEAQEALSQLFPPHQGRPAAVTGWLSATRAIVATALGQPAEAVRQFFDAHHAAHHSGQTRLRQFSMAGLADTFMRLNDLDIALDWSHRGMALAKHTAWPASLGRALLQWSELQQQLGQLDDAISCVDAALEVMHDMRDSRQYAMAQHQRAQLALEQGHGDAALSGFQLFEQLTGAHHEPELMALAWHSLARALIHLQRPEEAQAKALAALSLAEAHGLVAAQTQALIDLADIHARHALTPPPQLQAPTVSLHYLVQAQALSQSHQCLTPKLLEQLSRAHAEAGQHLEAYRHAEQALTLSHQAERQRVTNHALALKAKQELDQSPSETEYLRQLAGDLQQTTATLELLAEMGQAITASLQMQDVFATLHKHIATLLDSTCLVIYVLDADGQALSMAYGMEAGKPLPPNRFEIDATMSRVAQCARERRSLSINLEPDTDYATLEPDTLDTLSLLYEPMFSGEQLLGVISVQSPVRQAYGERERSIFKTLSAYGAIALANAKAFAATQSARQQADDALQELRQAQDELIQREKMASLGALVAGVAHELNTPIGNSQLVASTFREASQRFLEQVKAGSLRRSDLEQYCKTAEESSSLMLRSLNKAASLISGFKQLAVDQTSDQRRGFELRSVCDEVAITLSTRVSRAGHQLMVDVPDGLEMDSFPGPLGQVLTNLIMNAMMHGLEGVEGGRLQLLGRALDAGHVELRFSDNGRGIAPENMSHLFEPFFTTKKGKGGTGLGLHISANMVRNVLGGEITVSSELGRGTEFRLVLPRVAPGTA